jgi:hypothetical protein
MPQNDFTRAQILALHHAELEDLANAITPDLLAAAAHAALIEAINRDLVISIYTHGLDEEVILELQHFGEHPFMQPWQEFRKSLAWWAEHYAIVLSWPYPQEGDA